MAHITWLLLHRFLTVGFALAIGVGCSSWSDKAIGEPAGPHPLTRQQPFPFINAEPQSISIGFAFSGGGSRAAYLAAAVLHEIKRANLIDLAQVDAISAVSGGALGAAYFVTHLGPLTSELRQEEWDNYLDLMSRNYRQRQWYLHGLANPLSWLRILFARFNRGSLAREDYDGILFNGQTFGDLPLRPALYINALDVGNRVRFVFSRHFIDTGYYQPKMWLNTANSPQEMTSENDLVFTRVSPSSVRVADAVYASSAFPFVYPNLALNHYGNKIAFQGNYIFLADGGLTDNSGLLTLLTQMKIEVERSKSTRLVLVIYVDASLGVMGGSGTKYQREDIEEDYAWRDTYLGHGRNSVEAAIDHHEDSVFKFLESTGIILDDLILNYRSRLTAPPANANSPLVSWNGLTASGQLLLRPLVIGLRLREIFNSHYRLHFYYRNNTDEDKDRLIELFRKSGIPSGLDSDEWPSQAFGTLSQRISEIETEFFLPQDARSTLDLAAYILVHGKLAPALAEWKTIAPQ